MTERAEDIAAMFVRVVGGEDALRCKKAKVGRYYFEEILTVDSNGNGIDG